MNFIWASLRIARSTSNVHTMPSTRTVSIGDRECCAPVGNSNKGRPESIDTMDFASMSVDELWKLHETVKAGVAKKWLSR
jgi:hypothetical protein